jgi:hypothetical protein
LVDVCFEFASGHVGVCVSWVGRDAGFAVAFKVGLLDAGGFDDADVYFLVFVSICSCFQEEEG